MARILRRALAFGVSISTLSSVCAAQGSDGEGIASDEIVVTAQFREQNLQDTPLAITAVSGEKLWERGQTNASEIANQAPNVTLKEAGSAFGPSMTASIRGVGQYDFNPAYEPGVGVYVDDVYLPTLTGALIDLLDLERVEILRGPQGTLTGRNSIGGAIRLVSEKPSGENSGFFEGTYGSRDRIGVRGAADFAITDNLFGRISGVLKRQDGYVDRIDYGCANPASGVPTTRAAGDCLVSRDGNVNYNGLRAMLRYQPSDRFDIVVTGDYTLDERRAAPEVLTFASLDNVNTNTASGVALDSSLICGRFCNYATDGQPAGTFLAHFTEVAPGVFAPFPPNQPILAPVAFTVPFPLEETRAKNERVFEGFGVSTHVTVDLTDSLSFVSITAYREYESSFNNDSDLSPVNIGFGQNRLMHHFFSQEERINGEIGEHIQFTLGGYYSNQATQYFTIQDLRYAPIPLQFVGNDPVDARSAAAFATVIVSPFDNFNITGGVRYTKESKDYTFVRTNFDGSPNPFLGALNGAVGSYKGDKIDYRVSLDYRWSDEILTYATVSTGFKGGGIGPRPFVPAQVQPFGPETLNAYEVGIKTNWFDNRVTLNLAGFINKYDDIQLTLLSCPQFGGPGPCALPQNAGDADIKGVEVELLAEPVDGFTIDGSFSYLDFEYTRLEPATGLTGGVAPFTPDTKWSFGAQYEANLGEHGTLTPRVDVSYQSEFFTNANNGPLNEIDSYTLANARLIWRNQDRDLSIAFEVTNLADKYYYITSFDLTGAGAGHVSAQPARPREWAITVRREF